MKYFRIQQVHLSTNQQQVFHAGKALPLPTRGHRCLIELLQANQSILTKTHLMDVLWQEVIVSEDSLFKVIQEVRKELNRLGLPKETLKNVYGKGYQLQHVQVVEAPKPNHRKQLLAIALLSFVCLSACAFWYWQNRTEHTLSDDQFDALVADIHSDYKKHAIDYQKLEIGTHSSALDQLKVAYLKGLEHYKSGNYEQSITHIKQGINNYGKKPSTRALADAYLLLCRMYIYRQDKKALFQYLELAEKHYRAIGDHKGITATAISRARYHQSIFEYQTSVAQLNDVLSDAQKHGDSHNAMRAQANLAYSYQQLGQEQAYIESLEATLVMALDSSDGRYAAYAYGELSNIHQKQGRPIKAMEYALLTLNYVLKQKDTNVFQQGFSAFYNLLNELGHVALAEKYLTSAIGIQAHFNDEALLTVAEMNLARVYLNTQRFNQARTTLEALLATKLSVNDQLEAEALLATSSFGLHDNITAYTKAKKVFADTQASDRVKAQAGITLTLASHQLERNQEAKAVFLSTKKIIQPTWLFEYRQFLELSQLDLAQSHPNPTPELEQEAAQFAQKIQTIREQTQPPQKLMNELDQYINDILQ